MKLLHLANHHSTNIGNGALIFGAERALQEDLGADLAFVAEPWDDYTAAGTRRFDEAFVDRVNQTDGLLVGAAVAFNSRVDFRHAGMRLDLPIALWSKISKPIVFYGLSHRLWPHQRYPHREALRRTMRHLLEHPRVLFSVRNDGTKAWLESLLGRGSERIVSIPDPALYVPTTSASHPELADGKINIVLSLNHEDALYRFGGPWRERVWRAAAPWVSERRLLGLWSRLPEWRARKRRFLRQLAQAFERLARDWEVNVILCPHYFDDYPMLQEFASWVSPRLAYQRMVSTGVNRVPHAPAFYDLYAHADAVVSMRIHSMSPAIGLGTPCVALASQARMTEFLKDAELEEFGVDIADANLSDKLHGLLVRCLQERAMVQGRFRAARERMRQRSRACHQRIAELLGLEGRASPEAAGARRES